MNLSPIQVKKIHSSSGCGAWNVRQALQGGSLLHRSEAGGKLEAGQPSQEEVQQV